ncbi:hypothetical protein [Mycolicibacterium helvum]|nr:hypothetical protein [Mycolicibacterium helvum]
MVGDDCHDYGRLTNTGQEPAMHKAPMTLYAVLAIGVTTLW